PTVEENKNIITRATIKQVISTREVAFCFRSRRWRRRFRIKMRLILVRWMAKSCASPPDWTIVKTLLLDPTAESCLDMTALLPAPLVGWVIIFSTGASPRGSIEREEGGDEEI